MVSCWQVPTCIEEINTKTFRNASIPGLFNATVVYPFPTITDVRLEIATSIYSNCASECKFVKFSLLTILHDRPSTVFVPVPFSMGRLKKQNAAVEALARRNQTCKNKMNANRKTYSHVRISYFIAKPFRRPTRTYIDPVRYNHVKSHTMFWLWRTGLRPYDETRPVRYTKENIFLKIS